jgi:hypothetical protein
MLNVRRSLISSLVLTSSQKTKADAKLAATPTKTPAKQTPKKESKKEEEAKPVTPKKAKVVAKKAKVVAKYTRLVRNPQATLPIDVTFQGDVAQAKKVKTNYTHLLKLDAGTPFTLVDTVSPSPDITLATC